MVLINYRFLPKTIPEAGLTLFVFTIIPIIYYFELFIVLPKFYTQWSPIYMFHFIMGTFILMNICSNLMAIIFIDTSIKGRLMPSTLKANWRFCSVCETVAPPRSWHCNICNICILKRDHHCMFTSCCIGHYNHRYFLMFVFYMFIATVYASCYNVYFIMDHISFSSWLSIVKIVFPLATLFLDWSESQVYVFLVLIVFIGAATAGFLFYYHTDLMLRGCITHERNKKMGEYDEGKLNNAKNVLGERWYLVWISPFIQSNLNHNGIDWTGKQSQKAK